MALLVSLHYERKGGQVERLEEVISKDRIILHYGIHIHHQHLCFRIFLHKSPCSLLLGIADRATYCVEYDDIFTSSQLLQSESPLL